MSCLGDNHVFRFNDPEGVRKQRNRATLKSSMHISISAAELAELSGQGTPVTRPDSPTTSEEDLADVDWNFAKREAAFARLGLDPTLDNLPDEDLNKLYEKISKVKTLRDIHARRPESSTRHRSPGPWRQSQLWRGPGTSPATGPRTPNPHPPKMEMERSAGAPAYPQAP